MMSRANPADTTRRGGAIACGTAIALAVAFGNPGSAEAIPAFSREYKTECTTCHTIFPQRNEFGQAFEKNGLVWPGAAKKAKRVVQTEQERRSAEFVSLSGIPAVVPVSLELGVSYLYDDTKEDDFDQKLYSIELLGGGTLGGDRIGFWFNEVLGSNSNDGTGSPTGSPGPSQVYLIARRPLGVQADIRAGRFRPDLSLWRGSDHLLGRPLSIGYSVDGFAANAAQSGLEASALLGPRVQAVLGVNDRNDSSDSKRPNSVNDVYARVGAKFGGADYLGKEPDIDLDKDSVWDYLSLTCGAFGYSGSTSSGDGDEDDLWRAGVEAGASYKRFQLMLGVTAGENDTDDDPRDSTAASAEVNYIFSPKWAVALRYDWVDVDGKDTREVVSPGLIFAPLQSCKFTLRVTSDSNPTNAGPGEADSNTTASLSATLSF